MAVLGSTENVMAEIRGPELSDVVDDDEIGVEVDDAADGAREEIGEVDASVVERLIESPANGGGDLAAD